MNESIQNLAPVKPLLELKKATGDKHSNYLADSLKELFEDCLKRDAETWNEVALTTETVSNFTQGKQIFRLDPFSGQYRIQSIKNVNPNKITSINIMQFYLTDNMQRLASSNPDIEPSEIYLRSQYRKKVKDIKAVWNRYESKWFTAYFNQQEAMHSILSGNYIESVQYDTLNKSITVFHDIFGEKEIEISPGLGKCFEPGCDAEGTAKEFLPDENDTPKCPSCGSYAVTHSSPVSEMITQPIGRQGVTMGDFSLKIIPIQSARFDLKTRPEESTWFIERQEISKGKLRLLFGDNVEIPESDLTDKPLKSLRSIQRAGNTLSGERNGFMPDSSNTVVMDRFSLLPEDYAHITLGNDEKTVEGKVLPKGTKLTDICPDGMTIIGVNGLSKIIGVYPGIHHSQELSSGTFHMRLASGLGRGSEDTVEVQKRFNKFDSQHVRQMQAGATPAHTYIEGAVDRKHVQKIGRPGVAIPIRQEVAIAMGNNANLINQIQPASIAGNFFQYTYDILNRYRELTSHSTSFSNGMPGVDNTTATGARIGDANAQAIYLPMLQIKAGVRKRTATNLIKAYPKHFKGVGQYFSYGKTADNQSVGGFIKGDDIDPEIEMVVVRNSEQPKTRFHQQADVERMFAVAGGAAGIVQIKQVDPQLFQYLQDTYGLRLEEDSYDTLEDICRDRLEQGLNTLSTLQQFLQMQGGDPNEMPLEQLLNPETLATAIEPPIEVFEGKHDQKLQWFQEFLDTNEGYELKALERKLIGTFIQTHLMMAQQAAGILAQGQAQVEQAAQQPQNEQMMEQEAMRMEAEQAQKQAEMAEARDGKVLDAQLSIAQKAAEAKLNPKNEKTA